MQGKTTDRLLIRAARRRVAGIVAARASLLLLAAGAVTAVAPAVAQTQPTASAPQVYEYRVEHPLYGDIGTYTNVIAQKGDTVEVESKLRVAVKLLGVVMHREEADRHEEWRDGRLIGFQGVTDTNGEKVAVSGEARNNEFVISSPAGTVTAPETVRPSNPWSPRVVTGDLVMSTKSGKLIPVRITDEQSEVKTATGRTEKLKQYEIDGDKRQFVWFDEQGVPVAFRSVERGTPVDFVLRRYPSGAPQLWAGPAAASQGTASPAEGPRQAIALSSFNPP
jgi:Family of unknown function (DUF6134)